MNKKLAQVTPYAYSHEDKTRQVEHMFNHIAPTYDRLNHLMSLGIDRYWRHRAVATLLPYKPKKVLDIATGTGDFALLIERMLLPKQILGIDLAQEMLQIAVSKVKKAHREEVITFAQADCTHLTEIANGSFDAATIAFGLRNFEHIPEALAEIYRVLENNSTLVILELSTPTKFPMRQLFQLYARCVLPTLGALIAHNRRSYTYLPQSIAAFPQAEEMQLTIRRAGFEHVTYQKLTGGLCTLFVARKGE